MIPVSTSKLVKIYCLQKDDQIVATRTSGSFITPKYTSYGGKLYYTETGQEITNPDETTQQEVDAIESAASAQLAASDAIQTGDLIRFKENDLPALDVSQFSYIQSLEAEIAIEKELGDKSTSIYSKNGNKTTVDLFNSPSYQALGTKRMPVAQVLQAQLKLPPQQNKNPL